VGLGMVAVSLVIGLGAEFFVKTAKHAAGETLDRAGYVRTVKAADARIHEGKHP